MTRIKVQTVLLSIGTIAMVACGGGEATGPTGPATVAVTLPRASIEVGQSTNASATGADAKGVAVTLGTVTWASSNTSVATVSNTGAITAVAPGTTQISATSSGKTGLATLTVTASATECSGAVIRPSPGDVRPLTAAEAAGICIGSTSAAAEYVLVAFNNSTVASATSSFQLSATNTVSVTAALNVGAIDAAPALDAVVPVAMSDVSFRAREIAEIGPLPARKRIAKRSARGQRIPQTIDVGSVIQLNANMSGNLCTAARKDHPARLVARLPHVMVFVDTLSPRGGYTDAEMIGFATEFEAIGYGVDTLAFGAVTDIDENGHVIVFFTPGINAIPAPDGAFVGGLFAARDLIASDSTEGCIGSNEAEMFYMPVPDPDSTINKNYKSKTNLGRSAASTLSHEFQHLINASRRLYVTNASSFEVVWLNEGLSHIAEELGYYRASGNGPNANLSLQQVAASQAMVDAFNGYSAQNFARLFAYLAAPATNSPYSTVDGLETRGAIWQLLRYSADRKGGNELTYWNALVNARTNGQANFNAVFGNITDYTRDWAVAQFADDIGFSLPARYTNPSWNFRGIAPGFGLSRYPLATSQLIGGVPLPLVVNGGGAAYVRFRLPANASASLSGVASPGVALPANIELILVRTS